MTWCEGNDLGKKCGECLGCVREERDRYRLALERVLDWADGYLNRPAPEIYRIVASALAPCQGSSGAKE